LNFDHKVNIVELSIGVTLIDIPKKGKNGEMSWIDKNITIDEIEGSYKRERRNYKLIWSRWVKGFEANTYLFLVDSSGLARNSVSLWDCVSSNYGSGFLEETN